MLFPKVEDLAICVGGTKKGVVPFRPFPKGESWEGYKLSICEGGYLI